MPNYVPCITITANNKLTGVTVTSHNSLSLMNLIRHFCDCVTKHRLKRQRLSNNTHTHFIWQVYTSQPYYNYYL